MPVLQEETKGATKATPAPQEPLRELLAGQLLSLRHRDAYGVLGVAVGATDIVIEKAYAALAREYHPDRFRRASRETRQLADEIFGIIYQAYRMIATDELRFQYQQRFSTSELRDASVAGGNTLVAERLRRQASALIEENNWSEAEHFLSRAVDLCQDAGDLRAIYGWVKYNSDPQDDGAVQSAIHELRQAIELEPNHYQSLPLFGEDLC